ncbi:10946_t:CDS:2, partial [Ambispora leptoticha]
ESKQHKKKENNNNITKKEKKEMKYKKQQEDWKAKYNSEEEEEEKRRPNYACKKIGTVEDIQIKRSFTKARAILKINREREAEVPWAIPIGDDKLARITENIEDFDERNRRSKITARLRGVPRGASEKWLAKSDCNNKDNQDRSKRSRSREKEEKVINTRRKREEEKFSEESEYKESEAEESVKEETRKNRKKNFKEAKQKRTKNKEETSQYSLETALKEILKRLDNLERNPKTRGRGARRS